jgi:hypothetical protein
MANHASTMTNRAPGTRSAAPVHNFEPRRPAVPSASPLKLAHANLIGALLLEQAEPIVGTYADPFDVTDRAEHLAKVLHAVADYVDVIVSDTADYVPVGGIERKYLCGLLRDTFSELVGSITASAEECGER